MAKLQKSLPVVICEYALARPQRTKLLTNYVNILGQTDTRISLSLARRLREEKRSLLLSTFLTVQSEH
jgi:hypothetical protein